MGYQIDVWLDGKYNASYSDLEIIHIAEAHLI